MRPGSGSSKGRGRRRGNHSSSPTRERPTASGTRPSASLSSPPLVTEEFVAEFQERPTASVTRPSASLSSPPLVTEEFVAEFQDMQLGGLPISATQPSDFNPRSFPYSVKQKCWEKAEKVKGRDPDRWRRDPIGNLVFRKLVGCPGCLCHDYDHIVPYSKGGKSTLENCQVLQATVNRSKGNRTDISKADLIRRSSYCRVSGRDMDLVELSAYGNVRRDENSGGCFIQ